MNDCGYLEEREMLLIQHNVEEHSSLTNKSNIESKEPPLFLEPQQIPFANIRLPIQKRRSVSYSHAHSHCPNIWSAICLQRTFVLYCGIVPQVVPIEEKTCSQNYRHSSYGAFKNSYSQLLDSIKSNCDLLARAQLISACAGREQGWTGRIPEPSSLEFTCWSVVVEEGSCCWSNQITKFSVQVEVDGEGREDCGMRDSWMGNGWIQQRILLGMMFTVEYCGQVQDKW